VKPEPDENLLARAAELALEYLGSVDGRPVRAEATLEELRATLRVPLNDAPIAGDRVVEELAAAADPGLVQSQSPRYFGFVIGGAIDSAIAADWLTSAWDQNASGYPVSPASMVAEEAVSDWILDLLGLPASAGVGVTTGCQMAHFTCLAAARNRKLAEIGWDVERDGLFGAPPLRVVVGAHAHTSVFAALRMLGMGGGRVETIETDDQGRMLAGRLGEVLRSGEAPAIVIGQVGDVNSGAIDPLPDLASLAGEYGAWLHLDGAFGLWAAASPALRHLVEGAELANSWATDGHKWLNVPYDCGFAIVRDVDAQRASMTSFAGAEYIPPPQQDERYAAEYVAEFSRRARAFPAYAAIRTLGRSGIAEMVERCCSGARLMAELLAEGDEVQILNDVVLNQVLVRFTRAGVNVTDDVIAAVQQEGTCWMGGTTWDGQPAMRISVTNWRTAEADIRRSATAILQTAGYDLLAKK
jgi:glutamate/tyrosine decarboxylase-like PLP-dependent enzyme